MRIYRRRCQCSGAIWCQFRVGMRDMPVKRPRPKWFPIDQWGGHLSTTVLHMRELKSRRSKLYIFIERRRDILNSKRAVQKPTKHNSSVGRRVITFPTARTTAHWPHRRYTASYNSNQQQRRIADKVVLIVLPPPFNTNVSKITFNIWGLRCGLRVKLPQGVSQLLD